MSNKKTDLKKLVELIDGIDTVMLTTTAKGGRLVSRPLHAQNLQADGDLWFITSRNSHKVDEIKMHPQVNLAYSSPSANRFVSVAGHASLIFDKAKLAELWTPEMGLFYPQGEDDADICLLRVQIESAEYWDGPGGMLGNALYLVMTAVTQDPRMVSDNELMEFGKK